MSDVAKCLDTGDLQNLRLSSRFLRDRALFTFERRHIVRLESLEYLAAISRHAVSGREICTIAISDDDDTIREVNFEQPDGHLSFDGQVLGNEWSLLDRLVQGLREDEPAGPEVMDELMDESEEGSVEEG